MTVKILSVRKNAVRLRPTGANIDEVMQKLSKALASAECKDAVVDLRGFGYLQSMRVGALASTYHFVNHICGNLYLLVSSAEVKKAIEKLNFNNATVILDNDEPALVNIA